jgi:Ca-activated chloride channel family protein
VISLLPAVFLLLQAVISVHTELVAVPVTVTDPDGHHVSGLSQDNFRVYEDGRPQPIAVFHHGDSPVTLGLIVDRSQSMRPKARALRAAVSALLESSRPEDELFAVGFNDHVSLILPGGQPFTNDPQELQAALSATRAEGQTALYDGVAEALEHVQLGHATKYVLVVISDGGDNASRETYAGVLALAWRSQAAIYAIGLLGTSPIEEEEDAGLLKRLSKDTGGVAHFPRSAAEVAAAASDIARDLREQYMLGFSPGPRTAARAFRKIAVKVSAAGQGRLRVRTRSGYIVPRDGDEHDKGEEKDKR